jgi:8-oxo-dGTP pyrophosphatase MutT (NUDIX family)
VVSLADAPCELQCAIREFWPEAEWDHAAQIASLESGFDAFANLDTRDAEHPCGARLGTTSGVPVSAENSIGYFQINACNFPDWPAERFYNARHNAGTAHALWSERGWAPWFFSATTLGLI